MEKKTEKTGTGCGSGISRAVYLPFDHHQAQTAIAVHRDQVGVLADGEGTGVPIARMARRG